MLVGVRAYVAIVHVHSYIVNWRVGLWFFFFFFQAEDGIRDVAVTGAQTCALPIWRRPANDAESAPHGEGIGRCACGPERPAPRVAELPSSAWSTTWCGCGRSGRRPHAEARRAVAVAGGAPTTRLRRAHQAWCEERSGCHAGRFS